MTQPINIFISQFAAAYKANHHYLVTRRTCKAVLVAKTLQRLGLIRNIQMVPAYGLYEPKNLVKASAFKFDDYMIVWMDLPISSDSLDMPAGNMPKNNGFVRSVHAFSRFEINWKPSQRKKNRISYKQLNDRIKGYFNQIYILETTRGILTSEEALRWKIGGFILCTIHL